MKKVLITGSSKGIGKQIGLDLLDQNYFVYFNGRTLVPISTKLDWAFLQADLSEVSQLIHFTKIDELDVLILNAGVTDRTKFGEITLENWNHVFNVNLTNQFFLIQDLKDKIKDNGRIIFISSISGLTTDSVSIAYGVSKAAINMLVPYLAKEFAQRNITVNAIAPGYIQTSWHTSKDEAQIKRIKAKCLANRLGTTTEISKAVLSIINNDFINGQVLRVDGGFNII